MANEILLDNFTDTNGVSLDLHTPDVAPVSGWTEVLGNFDIQSNMANFVSGAADPSLAVINTGTTADKYIEMVATMGATSGTDNLGLVIRYTDVSNFLFLLQNEASSFQLWENVAGSLTLLATAGATPGISAGETFIMRVGLVDNLIMAAIRGATAGDVASFVWETTRFNTATIVGFRIRQSGTVTTSSRVDRLSVWPMPTNIAVGGVLRPVAFSGGLV